VLKALRMASLIDGDLSALAGADDLPSDAAGAVEGPLLVEGADAGSLPPV
jgi:hypothetical protein